MSDTILSPPEIHTIDSLILPTHQTRTLSNGIIVHSYSGGTQDVIKIEIVYMAGRRYESHPTVAHCTAALLTEGTSKMDSEEISEHFDYYGGVVSTRAGVDTARIRVFCMNKFLGKILPVVIDVLEKPTFPQEEIDTYLEKQIERLEIELTKNETIAYRSLTESIFGSNHPYGYNTVESDLEQVTRDAILGHHKSLYTTENIVIFVSGKITEETFALLDSNFGEMISSGRGQIGEKNIETTEERKIRIAGPQKHQAAIRIGRPLFNRTHEDFAGMYVMNTLLGGYFGSRLMKNIREDKGYTYGIYSSVDSFQHGGCFYISTEVSNDVVEASLAEIYREIELLKSTPVSLDELGMMQNYLLGYFMSQMDGPFGVMDIIKSLLLEAHSTEYFDTLIQKIKNITPLEIQELSRKYLDRKDLIEIVVVGE